MLNVVDLFSGIGGFTLGLESTGYFKTIQFVENEKWCQKILNKNFPEVPIHEDIKTYKGYDADVIVGGFPCQPFSVAGKQKAIQDDRHLWPDMFRVIRETKPTWVIGENVRNIVSISDGMVLEQVYLDLESQGYEVQSFIIPASAVNAPHQRYRTWIVAYSNSRGRRWQKRVRENDLQGSKRKEQTNYIIKTSKREPYDVAHTERMGWEQRATQSEKFEGKATPNNFDNSSERRSIRKASDDVADTDSQLRKGGGTIRQSRENGQRRFYTTQEKQTTHDLRSKTIRRNTVRGETENVAYTDSQRGCLWKTDRQNAEDVGQSPRCKVTGNWNFEPNVGRVANGIPNRVDRLRGLGNAIVPQIAYQIGMAIKGAEEC